MTNKAEIINQNIKTKDHVIIVSSKNKVIIVISM